VNYLTVTYPSTASILFEGQQYRNLQQVFLSSANFSLPSITAIDAFSTNPLVSAAFPPFSGYPLPSSYYYHTDDNHLYVSIPSFYIPYVHEGIYDIILFNVAGYSKLSDKGYNIKTVITNFGASLLQNILAYWKFDNTSWSDSTGNGHNLTKIGTGVSVGPGIVNGDAKFNGDGTTYLTTSANILPAGLTQLSMACWIKTSSSICFPINAATGNNYTTSGPALQLVSGGLGAGFLVYVNNNGYNVDRVDTYININDGTWHHLVGTWNQSGNITVYIDGVQVAQQPSSGLPINSTINYPFNFNANGDGTYAKGQACEIDEAGVWTRELLPVEVSNLYNINRSGGSYPFS